MPELMIALEPVILLLLLIQLSSAFCQSMKQMPRVLQTCFHARQPDLQS